MSEWGQRIDNKFRKTVSKKDYYLDTANQLYKEADKLLHSATDNILEIERKVNQQKKLSFNKTSGSNAINEKVRKPLMWLYKLCTADGNKNTSYLSASQKISLATEKLNTARKLLSTHKAPVANHKEQHTSLGEKIENAKKNIMIANSSIDRLQKKIIKLYNSHNNVPLSQEEVLSESKILGESNAEIEKLNYQRRKAEDSILPTDEIEKNDNPCIRHVQYKSLSHKKECCTFFKTIKEARKHPSMPLKQTSSETTPLLMNMNQNNITASISNS